MAEMLKQDFGLLVLQVALSVVGDAQRVEFKLEDCSEENRDQSVLDCWTDALDCFNPNSSGRDPGALAALAKRVAGGLAKTTTAPDAPLWLHLVKPYGWLGALGWEAELEPAVGRSVLRLPDFIEKARENPETLDAAVCSDLADDPASIAQLTRVIQAILKGSPRPKTKIHVFARPANSVALSTAFKSEARVWVAPPLFASDGATAASPWLLTMCAALRERAIDIAHFIICGGVSMERPMLCFVDPDDKPRPSLLRSVSAGELAATLIKLGAWAAVFTLPHGASDFDLRWFADSLARASPTVVAYDEESGDLAGVYGFLFAAAPSKPPSLGKGFLYCQPAITTGQPLSLGPLRSILAQNATLFHENAAKAARSMASYIDPALTSFATRFPQMAKKMGLPTPLAPWSNDATPTWIAAAQRYVEANAQQLLRKALDSHPTESLKGPLDETILSQIAQSDALTKRTLSQIQDIVARYAKKES